MVRMTIMTDNDVNDDDCESVFFLSQVKAFLPPQVPYKLSMFHAWGYETNVWQEIYVGAIYKVYMYNIDLHISFHICGKDTLYS